MTKRRSVGDETVLSLPQPAVTQQPWGMLQDCVVRRIFEKKKSKHVDSRTHVATMSAWLVDAGQNSRNLHPRPPCNVMSLQHITLVADIKIILRGNGCLALDQLRHDTTSCLSGVRQQSCVALVRLSRLGLSYSYFLESQPACLKVCRAPLSAQARELR